jgi:hypothetical protein
MYDKKWYVVQRVGLTEKEDQYLEDLQDALGFKNKHQVLRFIISQHRERHDKRESSTKSAGKVTRTKATRRAR